MLIYQVVINGLPLELRGGGAALSGLNVLNCEDAAGCVSRPCSQPAGPTRQQEGGIDSQQPPTATARGTAVGPTRQEEGGIGSQQTPTAAARSPAVGPTTPAFTGDSFLFFNNQEMHQK